MAWDFGGNILGPMSDAAKQLALIKLQHLLQEWGCCTTDFSLPHIDIMTAGVENELQYFMPFQQQLHKLHQDIILLSPLNNFK